MPGDWVQYWRAEAMPVEAMRAHFTTHVYHRHSHESYSFGVTEDGAQAFRCRDGRHVSGPGMVMLFNPDDPHDGHAADGGGFTYRMVHVWPELMASLIADMTGRPSGLPLFPVPVISDEAVAAALRRLARTLERGSAASRLQQFERLAEVTRQIVRHVPAGPSAGPARPAAGQRAASLVIATRMRDLIHDSCGAGGTELTMDALAEAAGCSRYAAYRAFTHVHGLAPSDYQRQLRTRTARRLLAVGTSPAVAAAEAGFADQAHLTRWFRRYYGVTPAVYQVATHQVAPAGA